METKRLICSRFVEKAKLNLVLEGHLDLEIWIHLFVFACKIR